MLGIMMGRMKLIDDISLVVVKSRFVGWSYSSEILIFIRNTVLLPAFISSPSISICNLYICVRIGFIPFAVWTFFL